jgi:hypothetical protein
MTDTIKAHDPEPNRGRYDRFWPLLWLVWLPFLDAPLMSLFGGHPAMLRLVVILSALAVFVAVYVWTAWSRAPGYGLSSWPARWLPGPSWLPLVVITSLSLALIMGDGSRWLALFIYTSAAAGLCLPQVPALRAVAALTLLALLLDWWQRDPLADLVQGMILIGAIGGGGVPPADAAE